MADNKDYVSTKDERGTINIAEEVIASIAALATADVSGVAGLAAAGGMDISELLGRKNLTKGVRLQLEEDAVIADVHLLVKYGHTVIDVAKAVQDSVSSTITSMTGLTVSAVNVHISGIVFDKESKTPERITEK